MTHLWRGLVQVNKGIIYSLLERVLKKLAEVKTLVCFIVEIEVPTKHEHLQDDQVAELLKQFKELRIQDTGAVSYVH